MELSGLLERSSVTAYVYSVYRKLTPETISPTASAKTRQTTNEVENKHLPSIPTPPDGTRYSGLDPRPRPDSTAVECSSPSYAARPRASSAESAYTRHRGDPSQSSAAGCNPRTTSPRAPHTAARHSARC